VVLLVQVGHDNAHRALVELDVAHGHLIARLGLEVLRHAVRGPPAAPQKLSSFFVGKCSWGRFLIEMKSIRAEAVIRPNLYKVTPEILARGKPYKTILSV
jgi:hypothetical protein